MHIWVSLYTLFKTTVQDSKPGLEQTMTIPVELVVKMIISMGIKMGIYYLEDQSRILASELIFILSFAHQRIAKSSTIVTKSYKYIPAAVLAVVTCREDGGHVENSLLPHCNACVYKRIHMEN